MNFDDLMRVYAQSYAGPAKCMRAGCEQEVRYMPVVIFHAQGMDDHHTWPTALCDVGYCAEHRRPLLLADVDTGTSEGVVSKVTEILQAQGLTPDVERTRVIWIELPLRN